jgi:hypothetical protein
MFRAGSRQARPGNVASNRASLSRGVAAANCDAPDGLSGLGVALARPGALFYLKNKSIHKTNDRGVA